MKSIILLTIIACSYGAKLDRGYLPPEHAQSSSGSQFLEAPIAQPIVVADDAVFHQSSAEANTVAIQRPQLNKGFVQIGSQASFAHGVEAKAVPGYLPPKNGFVQVGSQGSSFAQGVEVSTIVTPHQPINSFVQVGSHASNLAQGVEVSTIGTPHQPINTFVQIGSHASSLAHGVEAVERVHYQGQDFKVEHGPERPQAAHERNAAILRQDYQSDGKGYAYVYETENGIYGEENGVATHGVIAQGAFSYTGDDGVKYSMTYTADEHGFQPHGDHLPTPHPIPEEILKSLEQNARDEAAGIFDDGSYHPEKYGEHATYIANDVHNENQAQAVIVNEHVPVVHAEEAVVANALLPETGIQRPIYRHPGFGQQLVVNVPGHIAANVNRGYLPPIHQQILAKRSSPNGKSLYGTKNRQPSSNSKKAEKEKN